MRVNGAGSLILDTGDASIEQRAPSVYQEIDGVRREVVGRYVVTGPREVGKGLGTGDYLCFMDDDDVYVDGAFAAMRAAATQSPGRPLLFRMNHYGTVLWQAAELYEKAGRAREGAARLEQAVALRPSDDALVTALARLYNRTGDFTRAEATLTRRLKADPKSLATGSDLAALYAATWRPDDAKKIYNDILSQKPDDVAALIGLADVAVTEKKWLEATDYLSRARAAAPNDPVAGLRVVNM